MATSATRQQEPTTSRSNVSRPLLWFRRIALLFVILLAVETMWRWVSPNPDVGHFRSAEGRAAFDDAYAAAVAEMPPPTRSLTVPTRMGGVKCL